MMLLDIAGILGESEIKANPNWYQKIQLESMGYDISQRTSNSTGSGLVSGGATVGAMQISKQMDKSTPLLFLNLAQGQPIPICYIRVVRSGQAAGSSAVSPTGGLYEAETYTISNAIISSYSTSGALGPGGLPMESWSISFTKIVENYVQVDKNGIPLSGGAGNSVGYDFSTATPA
jgi:type VI protein secretion system component Hcp